MRLTWHSLTRGTVGAYQQWADQIGDPSFTFDNLLPYFEKSPNFTKPNYAKIQLVPGDNFTYDDTVFSPLGGPLHVSFSNYRQPISRFIVKAMNELGLPTLSGFNSGKLIGVATNTFAIDPSDETRSTSETSFLQNSIGAGRSVTVYTHTSAKRILFDGNKKATGVMVNSAGYDYLLSANKEVIVASGVVRFARLASNERPTLL